VGRAVTKPVLDVRAKKASAPEVAIIELTGSLVKSTVRDLEKAVAACNAKGLVHLVIDLAGLEEKGIDSAGVGTLLGIATKRGSRVALCRPPRMVEMLLTALAIGPILKILDDVDTALAYAASGAPPKPTLDHVYPILATDEWREGASGVSARVFANDPEAVKKNRLVTTPHAGSLSFVYARLAAAGIGGNLTYLTERDLAELAIDLAALHEGAVANLAAHHEAGSFEITRHPKRGQAELLLATGDEHFVAGLVAIPAFVKQLRTLLGGDPLVATPGRDVLVAFRSDRLRDRNTMGMIADFVEKSPRPLDRSVRRFRASGEIVLVREA
jgi:anti-anti-sigma factor